LAEEEGASSELLHEFEVQFLLREVLVKDHEMRFPVFNLASLKDTIGLILHCVELDVFTLDYGTSLALGLPVESIPKEGRDVRDCKVGYPPIIIAICSKKWQEVAFMVSRGVSVSTTLTGKGDSCLDALSTVDLDARDLGLFIDAVYPQVVGMGKEQLLSFCTDIIISQMYCHFKNVTAAPSMGDGGGGE
jgi:hypothetical protein